MDQQTTLHHLFSALPLLHAHHAPSSPVYPLLKKLARQEIESLFARSDSEKKPFGPFGSIAFPLFKMGAVNSLNLFDIDELILFSFYLVNRNRYQRVLDIGANIGLHALLLTKIGCKVQLFEPDPVHFKQLNHVLAINEAKVESLNCAAVSSQSGTAEFVRVLSNTTSSHLSGSKTPYGELERFQVPLYSIQSLKADLIKMDVEGHEGEIILATTKDYWKNTDCFVEVGSAETAQRIFAHLNKCNVSMFSQKTGWKKVEHSDQMPTNYKEGSLFITSKPSMNWT